MTLTHRPQAFLVRYAWLATCTVIVGCAGAADGSAEREKTQLDTEPGLVPAAATPEGISSPEACVSSNGGSGGAIAFACHPVQVKFVPPLEGTNYDIQLLTSNFSTAVLPFAAGKSAALHSDGVNTLGLWVSSGRPGAQSDAAFPTWVEVNVSRSGKLILSARWDALNYRCDALDAWNWCWQAAPLTAYTSVAPMGAR